MVVAMVAIVTIATIVLIGKVIVRARVAVAVTVLRRAHIARSQAQEMMLW